VEIRPVGARWYYGQTDMTKLIDASFATRRAYLKQLHISVTKRFLGHYCN